MFSLLVLISILTIKSFTNISLNYNSDYVLVNDIVTHSENISNIHSELIFDLFQYDKI